MGSQKWRLRRGATQQLPFCTGIPAPRTQRHLWEPVPSARSPPHPCSLCHSDSARTQGSAFPFAVDSTGGAHVSSCLRMNEPHTDLDATPPSPSDPSRRDFLSTAATLALSAAGLAVGAGALASARPGALTPSEIVLGRPEIAVGSLVFFAEHNIFVTRTPEGLGAFSARCTHLGCIVREGGAGLLCPCHGARFDRHGRVLAGPAPRDLPWLAVTMRADGGITVARREVASGTVTPLAREHER